MAPVPAAAKGLTLGGDGCVLGLVLVREGKGERLKGFCFIPFLNQIGYQFRFQQNIQRLKNQMDFQINHLNCNFLKFIIVFIQVNETNITLVLDFPCDLPLKIQTLVNISALCHI
jgi:hypothetical protein